MQGTPKLHNTLTENTIQNSSYKQTYYPPSPVDSSKSYHPKTQYLAIFAMTQCPDTTPTRFVGKAKSAFVATCLLKITQSLTRNSLRLLSIQNNYIAPKLVASSL